MDQKIDISKVKSRLNTERQRQRTEAREYGRELGATWAAEDADPTDLEQFVASDTHEGIVLDAGDRWHHLRKALPSLDDFLSSLDEDDDLRRYYRFHPLPLLEGFVAGAGEVQAAVDQLEGA